MLCAYENLEACRVHDMLAQRMLVDGFPLVMDLEQSHGSWIVDARDGREYLDFYTFCSTAPLGHNHPRLREVAFVRHLGEIAVNKPANADVYTVAMAEWVEKFSVHCLPSYLDKLFWIDGGSLAVENALKAAFDWKARKNRAKGVRGKGSQVIHFREAFHGRSGYALSLTNTADWRKFRDFPKFNWPRIPNPKLTFPLGNDRLAHVMAAEEKAVALIEAAVARDPDDIACLIIEPIQGEGGDNHFRGEFLARLRTLADQHDFLLVFDEVQTGFGATGLWWAHQHFGVEPDLLCFGKKSQQCGFAAGPRLNEVPNVFQIPSRISSTWGGNLVDMVRGARIIDVMVEEDVLAHSRGQGQRLLDALISIHADFPEHTENPRGKGLFCAIDLRTKDLRAEVVAQAWDMGMILSSAGRRSLRFRPALNLTADDLNLGMERLRASLQRAIANTPRPSQIPSDS